MSEIPNCSYRKTNQAIPLEFMDNYCIQELLSAMDGQGKIANVERKVQMEPSLFQEAVQNLVDLGLIEKD